MNRVASPLARKVLGIILSASLMAGCATAAQDLTAVQTPNPPPPAPDIRASGPSGPDTEAAPIPTPEAPSVTPITALDPTAEPPERGTAASAPVSKDPSESELLSALESLPLEFAGRGVWFANPKQSLEAGGAPRPRSFEEFESLPEDQRQRWARNSGGGVSNLLITARQTMPHWEGAFGFSFFQVDAVAVTGMGNYLPLETNYIAGEFDEETIAGRLADLGYRTEPVGDESYHAIRDDFEQDLSQTNPATRSVLGNVNRIFVGDNLLVVLPDTPPVVQVIRARNREAPSLAGSPAFWAMAAALSDPPPPRC